MADQTGTGSLPFLGFVTSRDFESNTDYVIDNVTQNVIVTSLADQNLSNGSSSSSSWHDPRLPAWAAVLIIIVCTLIVTGTVVGNIVVCTAVSVVKKLRTPSNWLIVSLAVADMLVALLVMPLAAVYEVKGKWVLNQTICDMWTSLDVMLCTASILNLCMISVDRYFVITRPFQYGIRRTPAVMALMIMCVWVLSAIISIPPLFGWKDDPKPDECELSQNIWYQIYATIGAFYLPLTVMIVIYYRIYVVSARLQKTESKTKSHPGDHGGGGGGGNRPGSMPSTGSKSSFDYNHAMYAGQNRLEVGETARQMSDPFDNAVPTTGRQNSVDSMPAFRANIRKSLSFLHRSASHKSASASRERKTTKTLGVIMGAFTACWLPFFILALVKPFLNDPSVIPLWLASTLQWLGFANSFFNPIIYARFNRDFRTPMIEIILCRCKHINVRLRSESYTEQYGLAGEGRGATTRRASRGGVLPEQSNAIGVGGGPAGTDGIDHNSRSNKCQDNGMYYSDYHKTPETAQS